MYRKLVATFFILAFVLGLSSDLVLAKKSEEKKDHEIPEIEGTYDVPGRPDMKVRVFVHNPKGKPPKPSPSSSPSPTLPPPSCIVDDPPSEALVGSTGWHLPSGEWTYNLNPESVPSSVGSSNLGIMAADAFSRWSTAIGGNRVTFSQGSPTASSRQAYDGRNIIAWGRAPGTALAITYTWYYISDNRVAEVDTIMNKKFPWSYVAYSSTVCVNPDTYDAQDILTHELGHWVGLNDMYEEAEFQNATMYGYGAKGEIKKDTLTNGDIAGTVLVY